MDNGRRRILGKNGEKDARKYKDGLRSETGHLLHGNRKEDRGAGADALRRRPSGGEMRASRSACTDSAKRELRSSSE